MNESRQIRISAGPPPAVGVVNPRRANGAKQRAGAAKPARRRLRASAGESSLRVDLTQGVAGSLAQRCVALLGNLLKLTPRAG